MENFNLFSYDFLLKSLGVDFIMNSCVEMCVIITFVSDILEPVRSAWRGWHCQKEDCSAQF